MRFPALAAALLVLVAPPASALRVEDAQIVDASGNPVVLKGFSWFGFNVDNTSMVYGIKDNATPSPKDFAHTVWRQRLLGFNAVRLPFSFWCLDNSVPSNLVYSCTLPTATEVAASVTPPGLGATGPAPPLPAPPARAPGLCNDYLPNSTTFDRFVWVVQFYARNGFYVLIDDHLREDQTVLDKGTADWVARWVALVTALAADPTTYSRLMIDVLNEPENFGIRWEATSERPALKDLYLAAMDAIEAAVPGLLFFVEGTGQGGINAGWGDGFATNPGVISSAGLSDPRPFFTALLAKPYRNRTVVSPHVSRAQRVLANTRLHISPCSTMRESMNTLYLLPRALRADIPGLCHRQWQRGVGCRPLRPPVHLLWHPDDRRLLRWQ
jgi:aryl-phospho-beta-D-glucosidase BglC (GH1 family)